MSRDNPIVFLDLISMQRLARVNKMAYKNIVEVVGKRADFGEYVWIPEQDPTYETIMRNFSAEVITNPSDKEIKAWIQGLSDS